MAARSIASLSLTFGLVSIPIKLYSATESSVAVRFKLMGAGGSRVRQQYVTDAPAEALGLEKAEEAEESKPVPVPRGAASRVVDLPASKREMALPPVPDLPAAAAAASAVVERSEMVRGYEFEKGKFVLFTSEELKALEEGSRQTIDIVAFIPEHRVDPIYYDKAYFLAPDKRGVKPYNLLLRAMRDTGRCGLAKWAFRSKEYVVEIRPAEGGMVLQQLLYAEEVRSLADLDIEQVDIGDAELELAKLLIEQISAATYDPTEFVDEERKRILAAVEEKISGQQTVAPEQAEPSASAQVLDLVATLRASLQPKPSSTTPTKPGKSIETSSERKPLKRAAPKGAGETASAKGHASRR